MAVGRQKFMDFLNQTAVVRFPRHRLATFGDSEIHYNLITSVSNGHPLSTLRTGIVAAQRPQILTPDVFSQRFQGFGPEAESFERILRDSFQEAFRGLQYVFRHRLDSTALHKMDARELARNIQRDLDERGVTHAAVICGPEEGWSFSLMKFIMEETNQSFADNIRELEERNLFDPDQTGTNRRRREVETLFRKTGQDSSMAPVLACKLKEYGLFNEYQDRFFSLVKK